jgi:hypothetical protein
VAEATERGVGTDLGEEVEAVVELIGLNEPEPVGLSGALRCVVAERTVNAATGATAVDVVSVTARDVGDTNGKWVGHGVLQKMDKWDTNTVFRIESACTRVGEQVRGS